MMFSFLDKSEPPSCHADAWGTAFDSDPGHQFDLQVSVHGNRYVRVYVCPRNEILSVGKAITFLQNWAKGVDNKGWTLGLHHMVQKR